MNNQYEMIVNNKWGGVEQQPFITVITPVFNRRALIRRAMDSVEKQTFRDIEFIVINDGSTEAIDDIVHDFMETSELPVMYVKKPNGGVHTARNVGYRMSRGVFVLCIDSDDELLPSACETLHRTWMSIPEERKPLYWQIKAQCVDLQGQITGTLFPENINVMPPDKAWEFFSIAKGEQIGFRRAIIMKENLFPEPEGVTLVAETVVWVPLERKYLSWGTNEVVRVYHTEGDEHYTKPKMTPQFFRNTLWNDAYFLNHRKTYIRTLREYIFKMIRYSVMAHMLNKTDREFVEANHLTGTLNRLCYLPFALGAPLSVVLYKKYKNRHQRS